jgi:accessory gene regulator B
MERLARNITRLIQYNDSDLSELDIKKIQFGLECILGEGSKILIYSIIFSIFHFMKYFFVALLFFSTIRVIAGGYHARTYWRCFFTSFLIFTVILVIGVYVYINFWMRILMGFISVILMYLYAPVDHPNKPILSVERRKKFKRLSIYITILFSMASFCLSQPYPVIAITSIFIEALSLLPGKFIKRGLSYESAKR